METENPYSAPAAFTVEARDEVILADGESLEARCAGQGKRLANLGLDYLGVGIFTVALVLIVSIAAPRAAEVLFESPIDTLVWIGCYLGYYLIFEAWLGRTPAKFITRTRVVDAFGCKPTFGRIAVRTLGRFIPFDCFTFFGTPARGWHDKIAATYVINNQQAA